MSYNYKFANLFIFSQTNQLNINKISRIIKVDRLKEEYHAYRTRERHYQTNGAFIKEKGTEITSIFYPKMFKAHPEL